jgi:hypothetical protein
LGQETVLAVDDRHVAFCEYNGSVARIICVAVATLANEKLLECVSDNDLLLCRKSSRIKHVIDNDWRVGGASKWIFATIKSTIDVVKLSNTIQLSPF